MTPHHRMNWLTRRLRWREREIYRTQTGPIHIGEVVNITGDVYRVTRSKKYGPVVVVYGIPTRPATGEPIRQR